MGDRKFAICIKSDDPDLLTPRKLYEILPDEKASSHDLLRVIDNEGEDYLYSADWFILVDFSSEVTDLLEQVH